MHRCMGLTCARRAAAGAASLVAGSRASSVRLDGAFLGDEGLHALAAVIARNTTMRELDLTYWPRAGPSGVSALLTALAVNRHLRIIKWCALACATRPQLIV